MREKWEALFCGGSELEYELFFLLYGGKGCYWGVLAYFLSGVVEVATYLSPLWCSKDLTQSSSALRSFSLHSASKAHSIIAVHPLFEDAHDLKNNSNSNNNNMETKHHMNPFLEKVSLGMLIALCLSVSLWFFFDDSPPMGTTTKTPTLTQDPSPWPERLAWVIFLAGFAVVVQFTTFGDVSNYGRFSTVADEDKQFYDANGRFDWSAYLRFTFSSPSNFSRLPCPAWLGWFVMEAPGAVLGVVIVSKAWPTMHSGSVPLHRSLAACLYVFHYVVRTSTSLLLKGRPMPVVIVLQSLLYNVANAYAQVHYHTRAATSPSSQQHSLSSSQLYGLFLFALGFTINQTADHTLRSLRKDSTDRNYYIPRGILFSLVSAPHYLGEIVEWVGYAFVAETKVAALFAASTASVVGPRAVAYHRWYLQKFKEEYPKRYALIPFVY